MKNGVLKKIRSSQGATMLMALLLMLVGLMVSAVVISAAVSTVAGIRTGEEQQQAYLTVESAAQLFRDTLEGSGGKYEILTVKKYSDRTLLYEVSSSESVTTASTGPFAAVLKDAMYNVIHQLPGTFSGTYEITVSDEDAYVPVTLEIMVEPRYQGTEMIGCTMEAEFYTAADSGKGLCRMKLTADAELNVRSGDYRTEKLRRIWRTVTWGSATIETPKTAVMGGNG